MVAPTLKTPRITNADKPTIVLDPGTLVFNNDTDVPEYVNLGGSFVQLTPGGTSVNVIHQQLWVNATDGLDTNDGGLYTPFQTYGAAAAHAALTASPTNRFLINIIGDQASTSPVLYPYVDLCWYAGTWTVSGGLGLDSSWDTVVNNELITIQGMKLSGFWTFSWIGNNGNIIRFLNCDHGLTTSGNFLSNPGSLNACQIINDTSLAATSYSSNLFLSNSPSVLFNATVSGEIRYDLLSDGLTVNHYLLNSTIPFGIVLKKTIPNTSTQVVHVRNTPMPTGSPVLEDPLSTVEIDTVSYLNDPTILLSGDYSQIITKGLNGIRQQIWVNDAVGNDLNNGGINQPFKTYDAARAFAAAVASPTNRFLMNIVGDMTLAGDFNINPYIDINFIDSTVTISGANGIILDASWTVSNEKVLIIGFKPVTTPGLNISWAANTYVGNVITFLNCNWAQCSAGFLFTSSYSNLNDNTVCIINDLNPIPSSFSSGLTVSDIKSKIESVNFGGDLNYTLLDDDYALNHYVSNCQVPGTLNITRPNGNAQQVVHIRNCRLANPINLDGQFCSFTIDVNSYNQAPIIGGLNSYLDVSVYGITDGLLMNTFTPSNWSFVAGSYVTDALTGHLKGIDAEFTTVNSAIAGLTIPYQEATNLTNVMVANNEYTANNASVVSLTLPITAAVGSTIRVNGKGAGGWRIDQQNAGHVIHVGAASTTVGPTGSLASATQFASVTLRCITANDVWEAISFAGTFTPA